VKSRLTFLKKAKRKRKLKASFSFGSKIRGVLRGALFRFMLLCSAMKARYMHDDGYN
jgi:hypothetical protein